MERLFFDALLDSARLIPLLLLIYIAIEWLEYRYSVTIQHTIQRAGKAGPLLGSLFGCIPQCGFSVMGSALYSRGFITLGTLLAVYLSTSDEALPVILAQSGRYQPAGLFAIIMTLLLTKLSIALVIGFAIDLVLRSRRLTPTPQPSVPALVGEGGGQAAGSAEEGDEIDVPACCGHHLEERQPFRKRLIHPIRHTTQVFLFLFLTSLALNYCIYLAGGTAQLGKYLLVGSFWQPVLTAVIGLIPNCAASVAITTVYLNGGISFGAVIAGLRSGAGLGLLVLFKEQHNLKESLRILALLLLTSMAVGIVIQAVEPLLK